MHINRSMVFLTRVNRFTCNIYTSSFQTTELCTYKENLIWCDQKSASMLQHIFAEYVVKSIRVFFIRQISLIHCRWEY